MWCSSFRTIFRYRVCVARATWNCEPRISLPGEHGDQRDRYDANFRVYFLSPSTTKTIPIGATMDHRERKRPDCRTAQLALRFCCKNATSRRAWTRRWRTRSDGLRRECLDSFAFANSWTDVRLRFHVVTFGQQWNQCGKIDATFFHKTFASSPRCHGDVSSSSHVHLR